MSEGNVLIGVIGGSGLYHLDNLTFVRKVNPQTPWGYPSAPIVISSLPSGTLVAFIARHGIGHVIQPSDVPSRANIAALKSLGVRVILAFSAVGSLREEITPGSFVLPTQIIDRTKGIRPVSFFSGTSIVAHAGFGDPFSNGLVKWLAPRVADVLAKGDREVKLFTDKCAVVMEGPQFSTRAESKMYRQWGGDLINMTALPEAKLSREAELSYALIATATDYDSWREQEEAVTTAKVLETLEVNADTSRVVAQKILDDLHAAINDPNNGHILLEEIGKMRSSIMPQSAAQKQEDRDKLAYILPEYFRCS